jgi:TonB family protein
MKRLTLVRLAALYVAVGILSWLHAQDVTVGDVIWAMTAPVPDELPVAKSRLRPDYPDEMRKTDELGYAIIYRFLDATGKGLSMSANGTHAPFQRSVEDAFQGWEMRPATRGGKPVNAEVWIPVIFNPKSASTKGPNATPRLLSVTPVVTSGRPTRSGGSPVVRMHVSLDASGAITKAAPEGDVTPRALAAIEVALKDWRFAPARENGQPVAAEAVVSVLCQPPPQTAQARIIPAKPISQEAPEYPLAMRRFGLRGQVLIDFEVDPTGKVQNAVIFQSDNPAFDEPALEALRQWKFEPGTSGGKPVVVKQRVPIIFQPRGDGTDAFRISDRGDQSKLPPEMRYDTPPKIRGVLIPVYPYAQRRDGVRGAARATLLIDPLGRVAAVKVQSADQPEFGLALTAALEGFVFDPALKDGKPVAHLLNFDQTFSRSELPDEGADRLGALEKKHPEKIAGANTLDAPLKPRSRRAPNFPTGVDGNVNTGSALIECLVDEEGRVRLPRVVEASAPAFGYAAVQAAATWWFEPPKAGGKPTVVRVRLPFNFTTPAAKKPPPG